MYTSTQLTRHLAVLHRSPQYIAPELSICPSFNYEQSSIWALGVSLYRMLVGKYPFYSGSGRDLTHRELFRKMLTSDFVLSKALSSGTVVVFAINQFDLCVLIILAKYRCPRFNTKNAFSWKCQSFIWSRHVSSLDTALCVLVWFGSKRSSRASRSS